MRGRPFIVAIGVCLLVGLRLAYAGDCVCEDAVQAGKYCPYVMSQNSCPALSTATQTYHVVPKPATAAQRAINVGDPSAMPPVPPSVPVIYRKVVNKLVVEMTTAEKQAVDQALAAAENLLQSYETEKQDPVYCVKEVLSDISGALTTRRDSLKQQIDTAPLDKALLKVMVDDSYALLEKVARCVRAARGPND